MFKIKRVCGQTLSVLGGIKEQKCKFLITTHYATEFGAKNR